MGARAAAADIRPDNCHARWYFRSGHRMVGITNYIQTRESRTSTQEIWWYFPAYGAVGLVVILFMPKRFDKDLGL